VPVRDPRLSAGQLGIVLGVQAHADGKASTVRLGTTAMVLEPATGPPVGRPARLILAGGTPRRLDRGLAHGAVLDLR
jgi:hypothetical protein